LQRGERPRGAEGRQQDGDENKRAMNVSHGGECIARLGAGCGTLSA
jgi:hypothetical protein